MPTENRSSNTEMVSVPRELTREMLNGVCMHPDLARSLWSALLKNAPQPAEQHQGEPVAVLYANGIVLTKADCGDVFDICCKVETPLYTHADSGEVERLHAQLEVANQAIAYASRQAEEKQKVTDALMADAKQFRGERDTLRAQQAETRKLLTWLCNDIDSGLTSTWHAKLQNHLDGLPLA